jgi:hypothetical protein
VFALQPTRLIHCLRQALEEEIMSTVGPDDERLESIYERLEELDPTTFEVRDTSRRVFHPTRMG